MKSGQMANKILLTYIVADILFVAMGAVEIGFAVIVNNVRDEVPSTGEEAARNLLYQRFPLSAGLVNAIFVFATFALSIPAIIIPTRGWLKVSGVMVSFCSLFTMIVGVYLWVLTLKTKADMSEQWNVQTSDVQDLLQTNFACCGYFNSTSPAFVTDDTCPSPAAAALMRGCAAPLTSFANIFIDDIFTALFGMVGIDVVLILATACLLKDRKEQERFRHIDEKAGFRSF
ncbi:putative tetraspanin protein [Zalerion maritima]|uniref:Tetraspanin protein n=1 Tax=Zalerion maritima TaxID=339359 RepID=A0AAD5RRA5_9PEZI|nr:putative tetraspanin protein [Zalerion maritima]